MSALLLMSLDGKRFHGRWTESLEHCITKSEFNSELRRINCEISRHMNRRSSMANLSYALPFICIPFGVLLIVLSFQSEKWPFAVAGIVLSISGALGTVLFRSVLGVVLTLCGMILAVVPFADKTAWVCIFIGTVLAIMGCIGLMAIALRRNQAMRSARILVVLLPISIIFFCVPASNLEYPAVMICTGIVLIVTGVLGAIDVATRPSRQLTKCIEDLRIVIDQLNQRYANRLIWRLMERPNEARGKLDWTLEILIEVDPSSSLTENRAPPGTNRNQAHAPVINVVVQSGDAQAPRDDVVLRVENN